MLPVSGELDPVHRAIMAGDETAVCHSLLKAAVQRPDSDRPVPACRSEQRSVSREGQIDDLAPVAGQNNRFRIFHGTRFGGPEIDLPVIPCRGEKRAVGREARRVDRCLMGIQHIALNNVRSSPDHGRIIETGRYEGAAVR